MSHLSQISFNNFRVFDSKTLFDLAPITLLTGPNSSGKSSVLKGLLLLKSNNVNSLQVLDFSGPKHNLGTFENAVNRDNKKSEGIVIGLQAKIGVSDSFSSSSFFKQTFTTKRGVFSVLKEFDDSAKSTINIELTYEQNDRSGKLKKIELFLPDDNGSFLKLQIGGIESNEMHSLYIDGAKIQKNKNLDQIFHNAILRINEGELEKKLKAKTYYHTTIFPPKDNVKEVYNDDPIAVFRKLYEKYVLDKFTFKQKRELHNYFLSLPLKLILNDFAEITENIDYLEAVRANTKRIYTNDSQGTSFNELILEYQSREITEEALAFTNKWLQKMEIADKICFDNIEGVATTVFLEKNNVRIALADLGYGITQFLPILMKITMEEPIKEKTDEDLVVVKKIILLEEPETNLHPKLQSMIADFLLDAIKTFEIRFIVETHSEYLLRKLQILTAEKKLKSNETIIYYFNEKKLNSQVEVSRIEINSNGSLTNEFGQGFYDEATALKLELLKFKQI